MLRTKEVKQRDRNCHGGGMGMEILFREKLWRRLGGRGGGQSYEYWKQIFFRPKKQQVQGA